MSRSFKKNNYTGNTFSKSEKRDKVRASRKARREAKLAIKQGKQIIPINRELTSNHSFSKDGKYYVDNPEYGKLIK